MAILKIYDVTDWKNNNYTNNYNKTTLIFTIHILPNISRSKRNQAIKFRQIKKYSMRNVFFKTHAENEVWRLVPDPSCFFKKLYMR